MAPFVRFLYLAPSDIMTLHGQVTGDVINSTYQRDWLTDGLCGRPVNSGSLSPNWDITNPAKNVNFIAAINWNLDPGLTLTSILTVGGPVLTVGTPITAPSGRIPVNNFAYFPTLEVVGCDSISLSITAPNSVPVIAGEYVAGKARELERPIARRGLRAYQQFNTRSDPQMGNVLVWRKDKLARKLTGRTVLTEAGMDALQAWYDSTNDGELMSVIVPDPLKQDVWAVKFIDFTFEKDLPHVYWVTLNFIEIPRVKW